MKRYIIISVIFMLASVEALCGRVHNDSIEITPRSALSLVIKACSDENNKYDYYIGEEFVQRNGYPCYFFLVDMKPGAGWEHPCKYAYVNVKIPMGKTNPRVILEEATRPLDNMELRPIMARKRYGTNSTLKSKVTKLNGNDFSSNEYAGNTYAVIISGGINKEANEERYWNDCSFIYQTLRNRYYIPKNNIKVLMSDGTDPSEDMISENREYMSSPLDLDDDGAPDIEYSATKANVKKVFDGMRNKLTERDHLFLFVIDHGGLDKKNGEPYICLWGGETLYPGELNFCLDGIEAGYISIVMGQCYSGGFVEPLRADNRLVMAACSADDLSYGCEDIPFDEFVYHWTSAVNGATAFGDKISADGNADGNVSLGEAYTYARQKDVYSNGDNPYASETPTYGCKAYIMFDDLSFSNIPEVGCDLFLSNNKMDTGKRPFDRSMFGNGKYKVILWNSSCIWARNTNDGFVNQSSENISFKGRDKVYLYAKVTNRGTKPYVYDKERPMRLLFYWAPSAFAITAADWKGIVEKDVSGTGGVAGGTKLEETIAPGESVVFECEWTPYPNFVLDDIRDIDDFHACFLAGLTYNKSYLSLEPEKETGIVHVSNTNKLSQKNLQFIDSYGQDHAKVDLGHTYSGLDSCMIRLYEINDTIAFREAEISLSLSPNLMSSWMNNGCKGKSITLQGKTDRRIMLKDSDSCLDAIPLMKDNKDFVRVNFNPIVSSDAMSSKEYTLDLTLTDKNGKVLGGETFVFVGSAKKPIDTSVNINIDDYGRYKLSADSNGNEMLYEWYDSDGNLIGEGASIDVPANAKASNYTVRAKSLEDGTVSYKEVSVPTIRKIESASVVAPGMLEIKFSSLTSKATSLQLVSLDNNTSVREFSVPESVTGYIINVDNPLSGVSQLNLVENGQVTENMKLKF